MNKVDILTVSFPLSNDPVGIYKSSVFSKLYNSSWKHKVCNIWVIWVEYSENPKQKRRYSSINLLTGVVWKGMFPRVIRRAHLVS